MNDMRAVVHAGPRHGYLTRSVLGGIEANCWRAAALLLPVLGPQVLPPSLFALIVVAILLARVCVLAAASDADQAAGWAWSETLIPLIGLAAAARFGIADLGGLCWAGCVLALPRQMKSWREPGQAGFVLSSALLLSLTLAGPALMRLIAPGYSIAAGAFPTLALGILLSVPGTSRPPLPVIGMITAEAALVWCVLPGFGLTGVAAVMALFAGLCSWPVQDRNIGRPVLGVAALGAAAIGLHQTLASYSPVLAFASAVMGFVGLGLLVLLSPGERAEGMVQLGRRLAGRRLPLPSGPAFATHKIVLIAYYYPPHREIGAARPYRFARFLRRSGADVRVVCAPAMVRRATDRHYLASEAPSEAPCRVHYRDSSGVGRWISAMLDGLERHLLPHKDRLGWLPCAYETAQRAMTGQCVVMSTHPPVVTHLVALALKLRFGRPWVADFRDPLWGNPTRTAWRAGLLDPLIERLVMAAADAIIANTDSSADLLRARYPAQAGKVHLIWNGFDPDDAIVPMPHPSAYTLSHVGSLYGDRCPVALIQAIQRLTAQGRLPEAWQFRQTGAIEARRLHDSPLLQLARSGEAYVCPHHVPEAAARLEMLSARVLVLLDMNDMNPGLQVPAKLFDYVRTGRPIMALTRPGSATERVLAMAGVQHACIDVGAPLDEFEDAIAAFLNAPLTASLPGEQFLRDFSAATQVDTLIALLDAVNRPGASAAVPA